jgi:uncharacterized integral membrane protein
MNIFKWMLMIFFCLFVIVVAVQNHQAFSTEVTFGVDLVFFRWQSAPLSVYLVSIISFCFGVLVTGLYGIINRFSMQKQIKILKKHVKEKETELTSLRNLPVTEDVIGTEQNPEVE